MYEDFGAVVSSHSVEFRLFFPDVAKDPAQYRRGGLPRIARLRVIGDFQSRIGQANWDQQRAPDLIRSDHPGGMLYTCRIEYLPPGFYQYRYLVTFENGRSRRCGDPCAKHVAPGHENPAFVIGGTSLPVAPIAHRLPFGDLVIYELMIDDFTASYRGRRAPVDAVADRLDHLLDLGVNAIEFMPWTAHPTAYFGWGYDPSLLFAVENRYLQDAAPPIEHVDRLKRLVNALHQRGLHVIMDGVFNHVNAGWSPETGFPYHWLYQDPADSPFTGDFGRGEFYEDFDYTNGCTQQLVFDACRFWLDEYQLDGIRFDYTTGYYRAEDPNRGIARLIGDLNTYLGAQDRPNVVLILEHLSENRFEAIDVTNRLGASGCWLDPFLYEVTRAAAEERADPRLLRVLDAGRDFAPGHGPVLYLENHDHSTLIDRVGGRDHWWRSQPAAIALFTSPGAILLHNGQEMGDDYVVPDFGAQRAIPRPVRWSYLEDDAGRRLFDLYRRLARLRRDHPALRSSNFYPRSYDGRHPHFDLQGYGVEADRGLVVYHRWGDGPDGAPERFTIVLNFSADDQYLDVPVATNGRWEELLDGAAADAEEYCLRDQRIPSHWGRIFYRSG